MALLFGSSGGGIFVSSVVADEVYDPVYDTAMDSSFIWNVLPSFYQLMEDRELFEVVWSGMMQTVGADLLNLWQIDYAKSLNTVPRLGQRRWVEFDFYRDVDFTEDPALARVGIPDIFTYDSDAELLRASPVNRARHDRNVVQLAGAVDEETSLAWSVELTVDSCQALGAVLFGYFPSDSNRMVNTLAVGLLGDESAADTPRPFIVHTGPSSSVAGAVSGNSISVGVEYRLSATYTANTGVCVLRVVELRNQKLTSSTGYTLNDLATVFTNVFRDDAVNFDTAGVVAGDILSVFGGEFEILSVDGFQLTVKPIGLAVDVDATTYEILGEVEVDSVSLNLAADAPNPVFTADQFGISSFDTRGAAGTFIASPSQTRRRSMSLTTDAWRFVDPTVGEVIFSLPRLQDTITDPTELLHEGTDFSVVVREGNTLDAATSTIRLQEPPLVTYWAEYVGYEESYIRDNFGVNVGIEDFSSDSYKAAVRGLYYAYFQGPTLDAIRTGVHILIGLPIAEEAGVVEAINPDFSGTLGLVTVNGEGYTYPKLVGTSLSVSDEVRQFEPLSDGVEVQDYLSDPTWFVNKAGFNEMQKYHSFQVSLNLDAFDVGTLAQAAAFVEEIKPTWKKAFFLVFKALQDEVEIADEILLAATLRLFDSICEPPLVVSYDDNIFEGSEADWAYDQGAVDWDSTTPSMRGTGTDMAGYVTLTNGSAAVAGTGTAFLAALGGPGVVVDRRVAVANHWRGTTLATTAGSAVVTDAGNIFNEVGRPVAVGDVISISGEGEFEVLSVDSATQLTLAAPLANTNTNVSYEITGSYATWVTVSSTTDATNLTLATVSPLNTGLYKLLLLNNFYFNVYYDRFEELCPDESVSFVATVSSAYAGGFPLAVTLPDGPTTTSTQNITAPLGSPGDSVSTTLAELVP